MSDFPFSIQCVACKAEVGFNIDDVDNLAGHIREERSKERRAADAELEDYSDLTNLVGGARHLQELAVAIRRGDRAEAEFHLDRIAEEIGDKAVEEVQQGRFSQRAKVHA